MLPCHLVECGHEKCGPRHHYHSLDGNVVATLPTDKSLAGPSGRQWRLSAVPRKCIVYDVGSTSRFSGRLPQPHLSPLDWWPVTAGTFTLPTACGDGAQPAAPRTQVQPQPPAVYSIVLPESLATRPIDGIGAGSAPCVVLPSYVGADGVRMWRLLMPKGTDLRSTQWAMLLQVRVQVAALTGDGQSVMSTDNVVTRTAVFLPSVLHARSSRR